MGSADTTPSPADDAPRAVAPGGTGADQAGEERPDTTAAAGAPAAPGGPVVPATRISAVWTALAAGLVFLVVVLVFVLQNLQEVRVTFFAAHWRSPLGVDLLLAAALGGLVVFAAGAVRLLQLRRVARRHAKANRDR